MIAAARFGIRVLRVIVAAVLRIVVVIVVRVVLVLVLGIRSLLDLGDLRDRDRKLTKADRNEDQQGNQNC